MIRRPQSVQAIYLFLVLGNTLAASFIWGINTIFLLDAGLNNLQAFAANAFFSLGFVIFEIPTIQALVGGVLIFIGAALPNLVFKKVD